MVSGGMKLAGGGVDGWASIICKESSGKVRMQSYQVLNLHSGRPKFSPHFVFSSFMALCTYKDRNYFVQRYFNQDPTVLSFLFQSFLQNYFFLLDSFGFWPLLSSYTCRKAKAYALGLILTLKGNASCRAKTSCSRDQAHTLFSASSISKYQNIFVSIRLIFAHAKLLPNTIP